MVALGSAMSVKARMTHFSNGKQQWEYENCVKLNVKTKLLVSHLVHPL